MGEHREIRTLNSVFHENKCIFIKDNSTPLTMQEKLYVLKLLLWSYNSIAFIEILDVAFSYTKIIKYITFLNFLDIVTFYDT